MYCGLEFFNLADPTMACKYWFRVDNWLDKNSFPRLRNLRRVNRKVNSSR